MDDPHAERAGGKQREGQNAALAVRSHAENTGKKDIDAGEDPPHRRDAEQRDQHAEDHGDALAAAPAVQHTERVPEYGGCHHGGKGKPHGIKDAQRKRHGDGALCHVQREAEQPHRHAAVDKDVGGAGVLVVGEGTDVLSDKQHRHKTAVEDAAGQKTEQNIE